MATSSQSNWAERVIRTAIPEGVDGLDDEQRLRLARVIVEMLRKRGIYCDIVSPEEET